MGASAVCAGGMVFPGHAAVAGERSAAREEVCTAKTDSRSENGQSSAVWRLCLEPTATGWSHGTLEAECWHGVMVWSRNTCSVDGTYLITKDGERLEPESKPGKYHLEYTPWGPYKVWDEQPSGPANPQYSGDFSGNSGGEFTLVLADRFTFKCSGAGNYTFKVGGRFTVSGENVPFNGSVTANGC
ncbi:hypothetical protein [Actinomadura rayongensis]|uniref:Uncharacterized protein n=1 Tax=Actinomadura rayongensis TaxID=1429076 RepID=A0A6I4W8X8_9ACTN|nr:hypothetical protein [Actinomadura rayongensis]MXQ65260.1 hypothetical protein [Actinomadura rayongensis]